MALASGIPCQQEESIAPDAEDGVIGDLSETEVKQAREGSSHLSLFAQGCKNNPV